MTIEIDAPELMPHLLAGLEAGGCSARRVSARACRVFYPLAESGEEALCELRFFARVWAITNGDVAVSVRPDC